MKSFLFALSGLAITHPLAAFAFPEFSERGREVMAQKTSGNWVAQGEDLLGTAYNFEGIVALNNCSGSLVRYTDSQNDDRALVLTNGHCVNLLDPGQVIVDEPSSRRFQVLDNNSENLGSVRATKLLFATMTRTDLAIYELQETYADISDRYDTQPLTLADQKPEQGTAIEVVSGYWKRGYSCSIEKFVTELREGRWSMYDSVKYSIPGCEVIGGTSGSPIIQKGTRTVVAINNTGNEDGKKCLENNPCEVDEKENITWEKGWNYGQQTYWIYTCRSEQGNIELDQPGCLLPKPQQNSIHN